MVTERTPTRRTRRTRRTTTTTTTTTTTRRRTRWAACGAIGILTFLTTLLGANGEPECQERSETRAVDVELDTGAWQTIVTGGLALFGGDVEANATLGPWTIGGASADAYGCAIGSVGDDFTGKDVLVVKRGECEFYEKARVAQDVGAKAVFVVSDGEDFTAMTCNEDQKLDVVTVLVTGTTGQAILDATTEVGATITIARSDALPRQFDFLASAALVALALATIALGGRWSLKDKRAVVSSKRDDDDIDGSSVGVEAHEGIEINEYSAFWFVIMASAVLLILFYSMQHWVFVVMRLVFSFASFQGLYVICFEALMSRRKSTSRDSRVLLPIVGSVHLLAIPAAVFAGLIVATWLIFRQATWAWMLQDIMGLSFLVNVLRLVHLPNFKVATILLCCAMLYDIFWVYVQPHLFGKKSVMVAVARGGDEGESLPMLFLFPRASSPGDFSMLGYGDVILPGLLIVHNLLFDNRKRDFSDTRYYYFFWSMVAYVVGMCLTFTALYFEVGGQGGQPALTYLVPTVVGTTGILAWKHDDLSDMWYGVDDDYSALPSESQSIL